ncbi:hypothetical protein MYO4S_00103 [Serratia phage 4S]|nr:hypothetical protein MYO4S_00103 [Serratia phage 4S]
MAGVVPIPVVWATDVTSVAQKDNVYDAMDYLNQPWDDSPPYPRGRWLSNAAGLGEVHLYYDSNHAFSSSQLVNDMSSRLNGNWNRARIFIHINQGAQICSGDVNSPTMWFGGDMVNVEFIKIINNGYIYGRGASAKPFDDWSGWGAQGGTAIYSELGGKLQIENYGQVRGGGGSGIGEWGDGAARGGGGGGAPLGIGHGSFGEGSPSTSATFFEKGLGARSVGDRITMGDGGGPGDQGGVGRYAPGDRGGQPGFYFHGAGRGAAWWIVPGDQRGYYTE